MTPTLGVQSFTGSELRHTELWERPQDPTLCTDTLSPALVLKLFALIEQGLNVSEVLAVSLSSILDSRMLYECLNHLNNNNKH